VGFRPTVHRIATALGLAGEVWNDPEGATAEVEGPPAATAAFVHRLRAELPPLARLDDIRVEEIPVQGGTAFVVAETRHGQRAGALVPPDAALCADCRRDMADPANRRSRYAFTTCTNCGPRFSLTRSLPYDRPATSMACFPMCLECSAEYTDPADRRFHAEPVCCPACGPTLWLQDALGVRRAEGTSAVVDARAALLAGEILAVKGLGGFQLACRADSDEVVGRLRTKKRRPRKPLAVMVRDLETARSLVTMSGDDEILLSSPRAPVLLAPRRLDADLADGVAPGLDDLGVMLPTTPLHVGLFRDPRMPPLVMTSANLSEEPICRSNREAADRLARIADGFLMHDRDVVRRVDDSVVRTTGLGPVLVRRARGWVPEPIALPVPSPEPLLAVGGHLMVTACVVVDGKAFLTQHVGDLDSTTARGFHREVIEGLEDFLQVRPKLIVADVHPDYPSGWLAGELATSRSGALVRVQHHLAHAAAVFGEHDRLPDGDDHALAVTFDGTGWGPDGTAWGGEWLRVDGRLRWRRLAHLEPLLLVGGELAVREPWRVAVAALAAAGRLDLVERLPFANTIDGALLGKVADLAGSPHWPRASGAGRLFEAGGALLGLATHNDWEGEAAARLESLAASSRGSVGPWPEVRIVKAGPTAILPTTGLLVAAAERVVAGEPPSEVAAGFHATFCRLAVEITAAVAGPGGGPVALGGGCMINRLLLSGIGGGLRAAGFEPLIPRLVPPGDGGLAYGQAVLGAAAASRNLEVSASAEDPARSS
jgi:hydrogenase maturation protein HypF